jgi:beta-apo-4'-carotenal oxygenase
LNVELHTAMAIDIPAFEATPVADIAGKVSKLRATFNTQKTKDVQFRLVQLRKLYWGY